MDGCTVGFVEPGLLEKGDVDVVIGKELFNGRDLGVEIALAVVGYDIEEVGISW